MANLQSLAVGVTGKTNTQFVLGTAQMGVQYGRVNDSGQPSRDLAIDMVRRAVSTGVTAVDTARAYGSAETIIGEALSCIPTLQAHVITKLDLSGLTAGSDTTEVWGRVKASVEASRRSLQTEKLNTALLHDWEHRDRWNGAAWHAICRLQDRGQIDFIGASVYTPSQALQAIEDARIQHLQIPINILDRRWNDAGVERAIARRPELVVHARSALLQGILAHPADRWPEIEAFDTQACAHQISQLAHAFGRRSKTDLCLAYVRSLPWISGVVVGCETMQQLEANLSFFSQPKLTAKQVLEIEQRFRDTPEDLLNPTRWNAICEPVAAH